MTFIVAADNNTVSLSPALKRLEKWFTAEFLCARDLWMRAREKSDIISHCACKNKFNGSVSSCAHVNSAKIILDYCQRTLTSYRRVRKDVASSKTLWINLKGREISAGNSEDQLTSVDKDKLALVVFNRDASESANKWITGFSLVGFKSSSMKIEREEKITLLVRLVESPLCELGSEKTILIPTHTKTRPTRFIFNFFV